MEQPTELTREQAEIIAAMALESLGDQAADAISRSKLSPVDMVEFQCVCDTIIETREARGWSIKQAAQQLGTPQYRVKDIEAGRLEQILPTIFTQYIDVLGLADWYADWSTRHPEVAGRLHQSDKASGSS